MKRVTRTKQVLGTGAAAVAAIAIAAGGFYTFSNHSATSPTMNPQKTTVGSVQPITFFQNAAFTGVKVTLQPDPLVQQRMPNVEPPSTPVIVYLPVYPGATPTKPVGSISDMGTPMDGDLVDGTLYYQSMDSPTQIESWYVQQLSPLGYKPSGQGQSSDGNGVVSQYYSFTADSPPGNPTKTPDIDLGFSARKQGDKTVFKVKALFIVTPPRPTDSYLPSDVVKIVLNNGKSTKTITDVTWMKTFVQMVNELQVSTPEITSGGPAVTNDSITSIDAVCYERSGSIIHVEFSLPSLMVTVGDGDVKLSAGGSPTLIKSIESAFNK